MSEPICAQKMPYSVTLEPGEYWWCACGRSRKQPFCDGSHAGTPFSPIEIVLDERETLWLCGCKRSASKPNCDGTHKRL
jgi:CDGSH-type Zn-finger protein